MIVENIGGVYSRENLFYSHIVLSGHLFAGAFREKLVTRPPCNGSVRKIIEAWFANK